MNVVIKSCVFQSIQNNEAGQCYLYTNYPMHFNFENFLANIVKYLGYQCENRISIIYVIRFKLSWCRDTQAGHEHFLMLNKYSRLPKKDFRSTHHASRTTLLCGLALMKRDMLPTCLDVRYKTHIVLQMCDLILKVR